MVLSDSEILKNLKKGDIEIIPFNREHLNPNSVDLTLGDKIKWYQYSLLDCKKINPTYEQIIPETGFVLAPNKVYLAACNEKISIYNNICGQVLCKSSLGRLGLDIIIGPSGFIDSNFSGSLVLELRATQPLIIYPNMKICQVRFDYVQGTILEGYNIKKGSKYMNQEGIQESLMYKNFNND